MALVKDNKLQSIKESNSTFIPYLIFSSAVVGSQPQTEHENVTKNTLWNIERDLDWSDTVQQSCDFWRLYWFTSLPQKQWKVMRILPHFSPVLLNLTTEKK